MTERPLLVDNITHIQDRFYGKIDFDQADLKLFQTEEIARLRHVSHSAVPTWSIPVGTCASKFEHSVGVWHLAKIISQKPEFQQISRDLQFAALAHDIGTPPFSHASEYFMTTVFGKNHEDFVDEIMGESEFSEEVVNQGGNLGRIESFIKGEDEHKLINGSIDLDNLDTSLRYGVSIGLINELPYSPEKLAEALTIIDGKLTIQHGNHEEIYGWERTRQVIYNFVYSHANLASGMMLSRALDFARREGKLTFDYFRMTDAQAHDYLLNHCNSKTQLIMERVNKWQYYPRIFNYSTRSPSTKTKDLFLNSDNRWVVSDEISRELNIPPEDISVFMGKDKGFKKIEIPILDGDNSTKEHHPTSKPKFMAQVYVRSKWEEKINQVHEIMNERLGL